ncbi:MAG: DUF4984 domain-containing protein [Bacteroidales bacterium]|nr:DUF4984 domain-containing protein [Bacteroidales bacterium]
MKVISNISYKLFAFAIVLLSVIGCQQKYITYHDAEYVMFADTAKTYVVREDMPTFDIPVVSTVACDYDRHFAVEIIDSSSSAVEGRDFSLESNNFTIPAGELVGNVTVSGNLSNLDGNSGDLSFSLKLVMPDDLVMPLYGDETIVHLRRTCKFNRENYTGWAVVTSMFLYQYSLTGDYQRLIRTSADPEDENSVILHSFLADGYDVKISFDDETDPANPSIEMPSDQVVSDESSVFGTVHGDNHILIEKSNQGPSYFFSCKSVAVMVNRFYVQKIGSDIGTVGHFMSEIDWISDEEADRLEREDGMRKH